MVKLGDWHNRVYRFNSYNRDRWVATQAARIPKGSRVLDVGAGTGPYRALFAHCEYRSHDFGKAPGQVGNYTELDYQSDITAIPVQEHSFDAILCTEVFEHVPEPIAALREISRVMRPTGRLLLTAPLGSFLHQEPYHFYGGYTPQWYRRFLPEVGFEIESLVANQGFFSLFGQEAQRFSSLIHPRRSPRRGCTWVCLSLLWLLTLPFFRGLFPLMGVWLDRLGLESTCTVGYHVVATVKQDSDSS